MAAKKLEDVFEQSLFRGRWLMAPFYVGLMIALIVLLHHLRQGSGRGNLEGPHTRPAREHGRSMAPDADRHVARRKPDPDGGVRRLREFRVSRIDLEGNPDKPDWMGRVDFSNMKLKLIASIIAISVIHLLKSFMSIETADKTNLVWLMILHGVFLVSGLVLALMDWLGEKGSENKLMGEPHGP